MEEEKILQENDFLVSTTDKSGKIIYANFGFADMAEYSVEELYGKPHNIVRHPDMPKSVFKFVWQRLLDKKSIVAYVKNYTSTKDKFYWVKAFIFPVIVNNEIIHISSYRTKPSRFAIEQVSTIYKQLIDYERSHSVDESLKVLTGFLEDRAMSYDLFINRLNSQKQVLNKTLLNIDIAKSKVDHIAFKSNIVSRTARGEKDIKVIQSCCCAFGKKLESFKNEPFTRDRNFATLQMMHDNIHKNLSAYVNADIQTRTTMEQEVNNDTKKLFDSLSTLIDKYTN